LVSVRGDQQVRQPIADDIGVQLSLRGLARTYGVASAVHALRDASFDVEAGEAIAIIGRSGSGKSTLLNLLGLLDTGTAGIYEVCGVAVDGLRESDRTNLRAQFFGFVFQQSYLLARRTALENVEVPLRLLGATRHERRERAMQTLASVGLEKRAAFMSSAMSGGECQRVALARALVHQPPVLLCDEPTGNLDERTTAEVLELLFAANRAGTTLIVVTHDLALARSFPRTLSVRDGRVSEGPESFFASESLITGASPEAQAPSVVTPQPRRHPD
jgi:ABC-type lipoprotein export system ATPase subunit